MRAFLATAPPCFALGMVEERKRQCGLLALRPEEEIPADISAKGLHFGHALFGNASFAVMHFVFAFSGFQTYNVLINPNHPLVQAVLATMLDGGDYFVFALNAHGGATAFRAEMGQEGLSVLKAHLARMQHATTTDGQYHQALASFAEHPQPEGILLHWVCGDHVDYVDLTTDRMALTPVEMGAGHRMLGGLSVRDARAALRCPAVRSP